MLRIGIDFDNTIACYDEVFRDVATSLGFIRKAELSSKVRIKEQVLQRPDGDRDWQRLQGLVYGKHMLRASVFPGILEFLYLSRFRGHQVFIVSHKTEFGHFDAEQTSLRDQALLWLKENKFFEDSGLPLRREDVFFEATRTEKIKRIRELGCTHFIDDLSEVFEESEFPGGVQKIWFRPGSLSWREMTRQVHDSWTEPEVHLALNAILPSLKIGQVELRKGRGNSQVYKLTGSSGENYALKVYPDRQLDRRPRLETEFSICQDLWNRGYPVAEPIARDLNFGWGVYRWIPGSMIEPADESFLEKAIEFLERLRADSRVSGSFEQFAAASEACLSGAEIVRQINARIESLSSVESPELADFLNNDFHPYFDRVVGYARQECGVLFDTELRAPLRIPSPSDFGSHNALQLEDHQVMFLDFEYFGWDDPVKLVSDFYWHPAMSLSSDLKGKWITQCLAIFRDDQTFAQRLSAYLPLYGLRWCLIILNVFLRAAVADQLLIDQLKKSRRLLATIKETAPSYGPAIQTS